MTGLRVQLYTVEAWEGLEQLAVRRARGAATVVRAADQLTWAYPTTTRLEVIWHPPHPRNARWPDLAAGRVVADWTPAAGWRLGERADRRLREVIGA